MSIRQDDVHESCGNVFEDLGLPRAAEKKEKVKVAVAINRRLEAHHLAGGQEAEILGCGAEEASALVGYRLRDFSLDRLKELLARFG